MLSADIEGRTTVFYCGPSKSDNRACHAGMETAGFQGLGGENPGRMNANRRRSVAKEGAAVMRWITLLMSATWMLWVGTEHSHQADQPSWEVISVWATREECLGGAERLVAGLRQAGYKGDSGHLHRYAAGRSVRLTLRCFPDASAPRTPGPP